MRVFATVAEVGSFRSAAIRLDRVQSAISHAIGNLEAQLDVELFDRSGHKPRLTPAGATLLADVKGLLLKVDIVRARARGLGQGVELEIVLALDPQFPLPPLCHALGAMHHRYPTVAFRILSTPLGASIDTLLEDRCDLAISGIDLVHPAVELESLIAVRRAALVSAFHPLAKLEGQQLDGATLSDHIQIVVEDSSERTRDRDFGVVSPLRWRVADNLTKHALIAAGMGWGSLPLWMIDHELQAGTLVRLPVAAFCEGGETVVASLAHKRLPTTVQERPLIVTRCRNGIATSRLNQAPALPDFTTANHGPVRTNGLRSWMPAASNAVAAAVRATTPVQFPMSCLAECPELPPSRQGQSLACGVQC